MDAVYLIGNGFDIKLGLKTKYSDFYEHYLKVKTNNLKIRGFKELLLEETQNTEKWSDLELELGLHMKELSLREDFDELLDDIQDELAEYLVNIQEQFKVLVNNGKTKNQKALQEEFLEHLFAPETYLKGRDAAIIRDFHKKINKRPDYFHIINFNYTNTIETLLGIENNSTEFSNLRRKGYARGVDNSLETLLHVHGTTDEDMVLGVNHREQINNASFADNLDITSQFVKPECNLAQRHGVELKCQDLIIKSDLIVIFGSSLGETDELWWQLIAKQMLERDCLLLVFVHSEVIKKRNPARSDRYKRALINRLFKTEVPKEISERVIVAFNTEIFSFQNLGKTVSDELFE